MERLSRPYRRVLHCKPGRDRVYSWQATLRINDVSDTPSVASHPVCPSRARPVYATVPILVSRAFQDILCQQDRGEDRREDSARTGAHHIRRKEPDGRHRVHVQAWILLLRSRCALLTLTPH